MSDPQTTTSPADRRADRLLTSMGLIFESGEAAREMIVATIDPETQLNGQLIEPLLRLARTEGGVLRMTDLAAQCRYNPSAITRVSDRLESLGYAKRDACPNDRRVVLLRLTEAGRAVVDDWIPEQVKVIDGVVFGGLTESERVELDRLMRKVRDAVHPEAETPSGGAGGACDGDS